MRGTLLIGPNTLTLSGYLLVYSKFLVLMSLKDRDTETPGERRGVLNEREEPKKFLAKNSLE